MSNIDYALLYAGLGWHVIPLHTPENGGCSCGKGECTHIGKHPRLRNWQQRASVDETQIREWWEQWPDANIGIVTGQQSGLLVLDNDTGHLDLTEAERVPTVSTGKGYHLYYAHPGGEIANRVRVTNGNDIRSDGGLVVAPPSLHASGKRYNWISDPSLPLSLPPPQLLMEISNDTNWCQTSDSPAPNNPTSSPAQGGGNGTTGYVAAALAGEIARVRNAREGQRNDQLNRAAFALGTLIGGGELDEGEAEAQLLDAAQQVGLGETEARRTIASGLAAGRAKPRQVAPAAPPAPKPQYDMDRVQHQHTPDYYMRERPALIEQQIILECLNEDELGDAKLFQRLYSGRLIYSYSDKAWFVWGGNAWFEDRTDLVLRLVAGQLPRQYLATAAELTPEIKTQKLTDALVKRSYHLRTLRRVGSVLGFARGLLGITGEEWDRDPWLLAVENGVIDLRRGKLRPGQPDDYIRTCSPTTWRGIDEPAPRFEQFVREIFDSNEDIAAFVQRLLGYGITGLVVEHVFPVLWGERGRNGKDTLLETLKKILGPLADTVSTDVLLATGSKGGAQPHIVDLRGKRLCWASETEMNARLNAAQVKLITGGGTIKTRQLYSRMIEFQPTHMIMLITNHKPKAHARDDALWNRMLLLPFNLRFVANPSAADERQRDPHLAEKLCQERSGILAWLVRGCLAWQEQGLNTPDLVRASTEDYRREEDIIGQFIDECCYLGEQASVKATHLYQVYREWAESAGLHPLNQMNFGKDLGKRFERRRTGYFFAYSGIGLRDDDHDPMIPMIPYSEKSTHEEGDMAKKLKKGIMGIMGSCPPPGQGQGGDERGQDEPGEDEPGQGQPGQGQPAVIPPAGVFRRNINDQRRDLISAARALLRERGAPVELATYDCQSMSVAQLKRLIEELEGRPKW